MQKEIVARMNKNPLSRDWVPSVKSFFAAQVMLHRASGKPGETARLQYLDERNQVREAAIAELQKSQYRER